MRVGKAKKGLEQYRASGFRLEGIVSCVFA